MEEKKIEVNGNDYNEESNSIISDVGGTNYTIKEVSTNVLSKNKD